MSVQIITKETIEEVTQGRKVEYPGDVDVQQQLRTTMQYFYVCLCNKLVHQTPKGKPLRCERECYEALESGCRNKHYKEVAVTEVITVNKTYLFYPEVLMYK